jgi:hypothetical protein
MKKESQQTPKEVIDGLLEKALPTGITGNSSIDRQNSIRQRYWFLRLIKKLGEPSLGLFFSNEEWDGEEIHQSH